MVFICCVTLHFLSVSEMVSICLVFFKVNTICLFFSVLIFIDFKKRIGLEVSSKKNFREILTDRHRGITFIQLQPDNYLSSCLEPVWLQHFSLNPKDSWKEVLVTSQ